MITLSKKVVEFLEAFIASIFVCTYKADGSVDIDYSLFADSARKCLMHLFALHEFIVVKAVKGEKPDATNAKDRFYLHVASPFCGDTPIVLKPRFKKAGNGKGAAIVGLYGYHAALKSKVTIAKRDIESFLERFDPDKFSKGRTIDDVLILAASRQLSEDIGNNFAQDCERELSKSAGLDAEAQSQAEAFIESTDAQWLKQTAIVAKWPNGQRIIAFVNAIRAAAAMSEDTE